VTAIQEPSTSLTRTPRSPLAAACATVCGIWLVTLIALPPLALGQTPSPGRSDGFDAREAAEARGTGTLGSDPEPLDWTQHPGAFEQELRRRVGNPLFSAKRQVVQPADLKAAKIRDASDARRVLSEFVDLSLDRRTLARAKTIEEMDLALARYESFLQTAMGVGGEVASLVGALDMSRAALIEQWRSAHKDHYEILAGLDRLLKSDALADPAIHNATHNEFAAQLQREDGPIRADELAPSLLSETPDTIEMVLATLPSEQRYEIQILALELIRNLQSLGLVVEDEQAKLDLLLADGGSQG